MNIVGTRCRPHAINVVGDINKYILIEKKTPPLYV